MRRTRPVRRSRLAPEVVQTSAMDCGPASLKCVLEGFGVSASYGRLREACQTEVDGTSIDTMEELAVRLGLDAEQLLIPSDYLFSDEAALLPAIVVVRLPNGFTHFVVVWRVHGPLVQVMDPASGRRWQTRAEFLPQVYIHRMRIAAATWREWAGSAWTLGLLRRRMAQAGLGAIEIEQHITTALGDSGWQGLAALDAAIRMMSSLVRAGGISRGPEAARLLRVLFDGGRSAGEQAIPSSFWSVHQNPLKDGDERLLVEGSVLVRVRGPRRAAAAEEGASTAHLSPDLAAALREKPAHPLRTLLSLLRDDGALAPYAIVGIVTVAAAATLFEAILFRGLLELGKLLVLPHQRLVAVAALICFLVVLLAIELPLQSSLQRLGRGLELRLRTAFLAKIPRLGLRYFQSRPSSDMSERCHSVHMLRAVPDLAAQVLRSTMTLLSTMVGIVWLHPHGLAIILLMTAVAVAAPLALQNLLIERDLRFRTHAGALGRFYLDALLGIVPIRAHAAQRAVRREHEGLLTDWYETGRSLVSLTITLEAAYAISTLGLSAWLIADYLGSTGDHGPMLLLSYWALSLPVLGQQLAQLTRQYPAYRNVTLRLLEPLGAPEEGAALGPASTVEKRTVACGKHGARIGLRGVVLRLGGHTILEGIDLDIEPGEHVAIVGLSGSGKSSLVGLLLGWHRPTAGQVFIDGHALDVESMAALRRDTAWVDPSVHLWNRSLLENILYGTPWDTEVPLRSAVETTELRSMLDRLPDGMETSLGEGGALVSGGEGQRVRLARALLRPSARLAILDEPFRGLDREKRRSLLARTRRFWETATLICVTHDIGETLTFPRVMVVEDGRIVEDGVPGELAARTDSRYRMLLDAEEDLRRGLWASKVWRRWRLVDGQVTEPP